MQYLNRIIHVSKIFCLNPHLGYLANSVDPDQPASSGSTLFAMQFMLCCSDFNWPFLRPYMGVIPNPKLVLILPISCILALTFPILIKHFQKCEGKCSFLKSQIKSLCCMVWLILIMTCIHLLIHLPKIANDGSFYMLLRETTSV